MLFYTTLCQTQFKMELKIVPSFLIWTLICLSMYCDCKIKHCSNTGHIVKCTGQELKTLPGEIAKNTTEIHIEYAAIQTLNTSVICHLQNLQNFRVEYSGVTDLVDDAFADLPSLKMISLKGNNLINLQPMVFSNLTMLKHVLLGENSLTSIENIFENLTSLEILSLTNNNISVISKETFKDLINLHQLDLNGNNIKQIPEGAFINNKNLMVLGLGSNPIATTENAFPERMQLQFLNLTACELTQFPRDLPPSIKHLQLSKNRIKAIFKSDTAQYVQMNALVLDENGLSYVEPGAFAQMTSLAHLFLFVNHLQGIPGPFPRRIQSVYLDNNHIDSISVDMFQNGTKLKVLSLRINKITSLVFNSFQNIRSIEELHLERNQISILPDNIFLLAFGLKHLSLNRLTLSAIFPDCFLGLTALQKLEMSFVHVPKSKVYGNIFRNLPALQVLQLQESPALAEIFLSNLIKGAKSIKTLAELNLMDNDLTTLSQEVAKYLPNLHTIALGGNKFHCNSELLWLKNWFAIEPDKFYKADHVRCYEPRYLRGKHISDVEPWQFYVAKPSSRNNSADNTYYYDETFTAEPGQSIDVTHYDLDGYHYPYDYDHNNYSSYDYHDEYDNYEFLSYTTITITEILSTESDFDQPEQSTSWTETPAANQTHMVSDGNEQTTSAYITDSTIKVLNNVNSNEQVPTSHPKPNGNENSSSLRAVGIAIGMSFAVIFVMLLAAFLVYKFWHRKHLASQQNGHICTEGQDYVFVVSHTETPEKPQPKVHRKLSRTERGSTTSRASEDITNHLDTNMKVYTLDVDA